MVLPVSLAGQSAFGISKNQRGGSDKASGGLPRGFAVLLTREDARRLTGAASQVSCSRRQVEFP